MVTETETESKPDLRWLEIQIERNAPDLGDLAAWLATAATSWVSGSAPLAILMNYKDLKTCITSQELQGPLTIHGHAYFKLTPAN